MKKLKELKKWFPRMSRKWRIVCNLLISLLLLAFVWMILGSPLPAAVEFRRMEQSMLLGSSEILAVVSGRRLDVEKIPDEFWKYQSEPTQELILKYLKKTKIVVGERDGYLVWSCDSGRGTVYGGSYEKRGSVNLWSVHTQLSSFTDGETEETVRTVAAAVVIVQTDLPEAHYAKLEWKGYHGFSEVGYDSNWCSGSGEIQDGGVFVIPVFQSSDPVINDEGINGRFDLNEAHLVLTDKDGTVIYDEILIVE